MADIQITCPKCSTVITVSEFVDPASLVCRNCGAPLPKPAPATTTKKKRSFKSKEDGLAGRPKEQSGPHKPPAPTQMDLMGPVPVRKRKFRFTHYMGSWLTFIVLGALMGVFRYGRLVDQTYVCMVQYYAVWILLIIWLIVLLKAFKDSVFQGILCVIIPPYSLYYLFAVSDDFYLRAVIGGFLVGVGQDCFMEFSVVVSGIFKFIEGWIARGGSST